MRGKLRSHQRLAALASHQYGVVSRRQLVRLGYSEAAIDRMASSGRLQPVHRGAYAVGHARLSPHGRCLAAVLACGPRALLSHGSAAWLWDLSPTCPTPAHVTVPTHGRSRASIRLHHAPALTDEDRTLREGIPVTALPRTLLDLASIAPRRLERAIEHTEQLGLFDLRPVESLLARCAGHPGAGRLRHALDAYRGPTFTRSELERRFLRLVREAGLPPPSVNTFTAGYELDAYWPLERFAVELDGYEFHKTRAAFEHDRIRQEELKLAGIEMVRVTDRRIADDPEGVARRLKTLLAQRRLALAPRQA
jgi:very-short-patch-repair endonuclease